MLHGGCTAITRGMRGDRFSSPLRERLPDELRDVVCTLTGEVRPRSDGSGSDVEYDVAELVWEPLA